MAGKRQHYLPQFLQRGFASAENDERVWVYRKGHQPRNSGIRDTGVEISFYSEGNDPAVDQEITEAEANEFSVTLNAARLGPLGVVDAGNFPRLFAHLEVRSRNLRHGFFLSTEYLWQESLLRLRDPNIGGRIFNAHLENRFEKILAQARHALRSRGLPLRSLNASTFKKNLLKEVPAMTERLEKQLKPILPQKLRAAAKSAHLNALRKSISPEVRVEQYRHLKFVIESVESGDLILGDSGIAFHVERADSIKPFVDKDDVVLAAILPLTPSRAVMGVSSSYEFSPAKVRSGIARSSLEFFVASEESQDNTDLMEEIGLDALPVSKQGLDDIITEVMNREMMNAAGVMEGF